MLGRRMELLILANGRVTILIDETNSQSMLVHKLEAGNVLNLAL